MGTCQKAPAHLQVPCLFWAALWGIFFSIPAAFRPPREHHVPNRALSTWPAPSRRGTARRFAGWEAQWTLLLATPGLSLCFRILPLHNHFYGLLLPFFFFFPPANVAMPLLPQGLTGLWVSPSPSLPSPGEQNPSLLPQLPSPGGHFAKCDLQDMALVSDPTVMWPCGSQLCLQHPNQCSENKLASKPSV